MSPKVSTQYKIELREKILRSAIIIFSKYGFDKARMEDISIKADISKGTLYLYFKSKEELFFAISENNIKKLKEHLDLLLTQKKEDLIYNIEKFYDNFHTAIKDDEQKVYLELISECSRNPKIKKVVYEQRIKIFNIVSKYLNLQIDTGFFKKDIDVDAIASGLVSIYDGLTLSKIIGINNDFNKRTWTKTIKAIFESISRQKL
jgi:TetR/AcrR family transcriptional regulator, repressor for uid operon